MVQWLRLHASTAGGTGSVLGGGTKLPHVPQHSQKQTDIKLNADEAILGAETLECHINILNLRMNLLIRFTFRLRMS